MRFAPKGVGARSATLNVTSNAAPAEVVLGGTGSPVLGGTGSPAGATGKPRISSLSLTHRVFRVGRRPRGGARGVKSGTAFRFALSEPASVTFTIQRKTTGRRVGGRCRTLTRKNRKAKHCIRYVAVGSFTKKLLAGKRSVSFAGKLSGRALRRGSYRAVLKARDAAKNVSAAHVTTFRIVR